MAIFVLVKVINKTLTFEPDRLNDIATGLKTPQNRVYEGFEKA